MMVPFRITVYVVTCCKLLPVIGEATRVISNVCHS